MTLRVLLMGSQAEDLLFLQDVLREIEDQRLLPEWPRIEPECAITLLEAARILTTSPPHAILLDVDAPSESQSPVSHPASVSHQEMGAFQLVQVAAPDVPVILLTKPEDEPLAMRLMRDGAEDFLSKDQVDCAPLAHALRNAVLRHRLLSAARACALSDSLTGLPNRAGFLAMAARDRKLAERLDRRWMLLVAEPRFLAEISQAQGEQRRDLELVEAGEQLRSIATPADLVARIGDGQFAIGVFETSVESVEEAWVRVRGAAAEHRMHVGASIFDRSRPLTLDAMMEQAVSDLPPRREPKVAGAA